MQKTQTRDSLIFYAAATRAEVDEEDSLIQIAEAFPL